MPKILVVGEAEVYRELQGILDERDLEFADNYILALKISNKSYDNFILAGSLSMLKNQGLQPLGIQLAKEISKKFNIEFEKFTLVSSDNEKLAEAKDMGIKKLYSKVMADEEQGFRSIYQLVDDIKKDFGL